MDALNKIITTKDYSQALTAKLKTVTKGYRHIIRKITDAEANELGSTPNWFMFNNRQTVIEQRECGQWIVWAF